MGRAFVWAVMGGVFCAALGAGCSDGGVARGTPPYAVGGDGAGAISSSGGGEDGGTSAAAGGGNDPVPAGQGVGDTCSNDDPRREGLICNARDVCEPSGAKAPGDPCVISAECAEGQCLSRE